MDNDLAHGGDGDGLGRKSSPTNAHYISVIKGDRFITLFFVPAFLGLFCYPEYVHKQWEDFSILLFLIISPKLYCIFHG